MQVKPKAASGCKLVGTIKGTKLWAGECVANELRTERSEPISAVPPTGEK
jgi:hypothetical protein